MRTSFSANQAISGLSRPRDSLSQLVAAMDDPLTGCGRLQGPNWHIWHRLRARFGAGINTAEVRTQLVWDRVRVKRLQSRLAAERNNK